MRLVEVVFEEEINSFGLSEEEIKEIARGVLAKREGNGVTIEIEDINIATISFRVVNKSWGRNSDFLETAMTELDKILKDIMSKLKHYSSIKPFLAIYSRNGNSNREIFEKAGIEVIS